MGNDQNFTNNRTYNQPHKGIVHNNDSEKQLLYAAMDGFQQHYFGQKRPDTEEHNMMDDLMSIQLKTGKSQLWCQNQDGGYHQMGWEQVRTGRYLSGVLLVLFTILSTNYTGMLNFENLYNCILM